MTSNTDPRPGSPNCKTPNWSSCLDATQNPVKAEIANRVFWSLASIWYAAWPESRTDSVRLACKQSKVILRRLLAVLFIQCVYSQHWLFIYSQMNFVVSWVGVWEKMSKDCLHSTKWYCTLDLIVIVSLCQSNLLSISTPYWRPWCRSFDMKHVLVLKVLQTSLNLSKNTKYYYQHSKSCHWAPVPYQEAKMHIQEVSYFLLIAESCRTFDYAK